MPWTVPPLDPAWPGLSARSWRSPLPLPSSQMIVYGRNLLTTLQAHVTRKNYCLWQGPANCFASACNQKASACAFNHLRTSCARVNQCNDWLAKQNRCRCASVTRVYAGCQDTIIREVGVVTRGVYVSRLGTVKDGSVWVVSMYGIVPLQCGCDTCMPMSSVSRILWKLSKIHTPF